MTTESSELKRLFPAGEPFTDLLDELDELARRSNAWEEDDWIPVDQFYVELNRISAEACRRKGEPHHPFPTGGGPQPGHQPTAEDLEQAFGIWMVTRAKAENRDRSLPSISNDEVWAEFEDELGPYDPDEELDLGPGWAKDPA